MKTSMLEEIYELIHSLSKNEKRYFRLFAEFQSGNKTYLRLFDIIEKEKDFNEKRIVQLFFKQGKGSNLSAVKKYLFHQLVCSLKSFGAYKDLDSDHTDLIETYKVLRYKGLHGQSQRLLKTIKEMTLSDDAFLRHYYVLLLQYFEIVYNPDDAIANRLNDLFEEKKQVLKIIQNYSWVGDIFALQRVFLRKNLYCRSPKEKKELTALVNPLLKSNEKGMLSRTALGLRNMALCDYYMAIGRPRKALEISKVYVELRRNAGSFDKVDTQTISEQAQFLWLSIRCGMYKNLQQSLDQYKEFADNIRNKDKHAIAYERWLIYSLICFIHTGKLNDAISLLQSERKNIQKHEECMTKKTKISIQYFTAYLHFARQDYGSSLKFIQEVINKSSDDTEEFIFAKLLLMFVHYELKNYDLLNYQVRSAQRVMQKKERLYDCEKHVLSFLKKVSTVRSKEIHKQEAERLLKEVTTLFKKPYEMGFIYYFDIQAWLRSKLSDRPFSSMLSQKSINSL